MKGDVGYLFLITGGLLVLAGPWLAQAIWLVGVAAELWWNHGDDA